MESLKLAWGNDASPSRALLWILLLYVLITTGYGVVNPLFEAPDEHFHYFTVQHILDHGNLPVVTASAAEWLGPEPAQPPLYYLLGAALIAPVHATEVREQLWFNPHTWIGNADALTNVNRFVHTALEAWPWRGFALAAHLLRGLSTILGLGTLLSIYGSGRLLWPNDDRALLATALAGFLPQFNFVHAAISNDALITFLCSAALWQLLHIWLSGRTRRRLLLVGATVGLAALAKNAGILLLLFAPGVLALQVLRENPGAERGRPSSPGGALGEIAGLVILPVLILAGWLWWRNWTLYGDLTAANQFVRLAGGDRGYSLRQVLAETSGLWTSFFAIFGWFNIRAPEWLYWLWNGLVGLGALGVLWRLSRSVFGRRQRNRAIQVPDPHHPAASPGGLLQAEWLTAVLLFTWVLVVYASLLLFMTKTEAAQGRLLFPAILPLALGLAYGLAAWRWWLLHWLAALIALGTTLYCLIFVIAPVFALPNLVAALPADALTLDQEAGQGLRLAGAMVETETAAPGEVVWLTLYWQAERTPSRVPEFVFELFGQDLAQPVGKVQAYHGRGLFPATLWPPAQLVADRFAFRLSAEIDAPVLTRGFARLADAGGNAGAGKGIYVGSIKVVPARWPETSGDVLARVGDTVELTAVTLVQDGTRPGDLVRIGVTWHAVSAPEKPLTTLIHLAHPGQPPLATGDSPPRAGHYPTDAWAAGEVIQDAYELVIPALPEGRYPLWIGMYDPETLAPLALAVDGRPQSDGRYMVGWVEVGPS